MPEISRFFGIVIKMFIDDHNPPHFHAFYGEYEGLVEIIASANKYIKLSFPRRRESRPPIQSGAGLDARFHACALKRFGAQARA